MVFDYIRLNRQILVPAADTQVEAGTTLVVTGGITSAEQLRVSGTGAAGQPGAISVPAGANTVTGSVTLLGNTTVDVASGASLTLSNTVQGAAALTKTGDGDADAVRDNTYSGVDQRQRRHAAGRRLARGRRSRDRCHGQHRRDAGRDRRHQRHGGHGRDRHDRCGDGDSTGTLEVGDGPRDWRWPGRRRGRPTGRNCGGHSGTRWPSWARWR